jgi:hypothetical protein
MVTRHDDDDGMGEAGDQGRKENYVEGRGSGITVSHRVAPQRVELERLGLEKSV